MGIPVICIKNLWRRSRDVSMLNPEFSVELSAFFKCFDKMHSNRKNNPHFTGMGNNENEKENYNYG